jgi:hypothetical protein
MIDLALAAVPSRPSGLLLALLAMAAYVFVFGLIIISLIRVAGYFKNAGKEQKLLRIEMGKLAEEVHLLRQKIEGDKAGDAPNQ